MEKNLQFHYEIKEDEKNIIISKYKDNNIFIMQKFFDKKNFSYDKNISIEENLKNFSKQSEKIGFKINQANILLRAQYKYWVYYFEGRGQEDYNCFLGHFDSIEKVIGAIKKHSMEIRYIIPGSARYNISDHGFIRNFHASKNELELEKEIKEKLKR